MKVYFDAVSHRLGRVEIVALSIFPGVQMTQIVFNEKALQ